MSMARRRDENAERTRRSLVEHARAEFTERGFAKTSLDRIAASARVTKGAVYHHFANKKDLFRAVYEALAQQMDASVSERVDAAPNPMARMLAGIDAFLDGANDESMRVVMFRDGTAVLAGECREIDERYFLDRLNSELGRFRKPDELTPHLSRIVLAALIEAAQILGQSDDVQQTRDELRRALVLLFSSLLTH